MTRDEYLEVLATEPATGTQVGAIIGEFERLGVANRAERLAISAELLGVDKLASTADLVMGQAGYLVALLQRTRDRTALAAAALAIGEVQAVDEHQGDEPGMTFAEAVLQAFPALHEWVITQKHDKSNNLCGKFS